MFFFRETVAWCKWFAQRGGAKHPLPRKQPVESMPWKNNMQWDGIVFGEGVKTVFSVLPHINWYNVSSKCTHANIYYVVIQNACLGLWGKRMQKGEMIILYNTHELDQTWATNFLSYTYGQMIETYWNQRTSNRMDWDILEKSAAFCGLMEGGSKNAQVAYLGREAFSGMVLMSLEKTMLHPHSPRKGTISRGN